MKSHRPHLLILLVSSLLALVSATDEYMFTLSADNAYSNQVAMQPLLTNEAFGDSWNTPADVQYTPPAQNFNRVILELNVNTTGSNYDRLGQMFVDNIEIWRTSTAEPDGKGASWSVRKDVSHYSELFKSPRTINFLIQNLVTDVYTGVFFVTLNAYFYDDAQSDPSTGDSWAIDLNNVPNQVQALAKSNSTPSTSWMAPDDHISVSVGPLERSVNRALVHVFASGNGDDEFWWDSAHNTSTAGPSRFIDVYVGGQLAGFAAPYPTIFTGGVDPLLWRPLVDVRTFDIPAYYIDITPFLPALWENSTDIEVKVTNGVDDDEIPSNWIISYNLLTWSTSGQSNSGEISGAPQFSHSTSGDSPGAVLVNRTLTTSASLNIGGKQQDVQWTQQVGYNNTLVVSSQSNSHVWQATQGSSSLSGLYNVSSSFNFPFQCEMDDGSMYRVQQVYQTETEGNTYDTWIDSTVYLNNGNYSSAHSSQWLSFPGGSHYAETNDLQLVQKW